MSRLGRKISSFIWWTYPRGSLEYDIMVGIILAFIFLTPRQFFRDQPRPSPMPVFAANPAPPSHTARAGIHSGLPLTHPAVARSRHAAS